MCASGKTILVVDDDTAIRETLADILQDEGYAAVTAMDGKDALEKLRNGLRPCVILLDLMMPVMTGAELYREMRNDVDLAAIPVVLVSADNNLKVKANALSGMYLPKPLKIDPVLATVERHCA